MAALAAGAVLVAMALPVLHLHTAQSGLDALPNSAPTVPTIKKVQAAFSNGTADRTQIAIEGDIDAPATQQAVAELKSKIVAAGLNTGAIDTEVNGRTPWRGRHPARRQGHGLRVDTALNTLRDDILPSTIGTVRGADYAVTGTRRCRRTRTRC